MDSIDIPIDFINDAYQAISLDCLVEPGETAHILSGATATTRLLKKRLKVLESRLLKLLELKKYKLCWERF